MTITYETTDRVLEITRSKTTNYHYLSLLSLSSEDIEELRRQGFVSPEVRDGHKYFKLRFRRHGRQAVIGLGNDPWLAQKTDGELAELQANRRLEVKQTRLIRAARGRLRQSKLALEPALSDAGYRFHGYEIRRARGKNAVEQKGSSDPRE